MSRKSAELSAILSFFIPGLGQVYNGEFVKAFLFVGGTMLVAALCAAWIGFLLALPLWIWAVADAYHSAERINIDDEEAHG